MSGLISKTWINDGDTVGGFYVYADRASADNYLESEIIKRIKTAPIFSDFQVRHSDVLEEFSGVTGVRDIALAAR